jgi:catechol 2,3-dioxygenase-like lactoylglutathione lyase family enzyme
MDKAILFYTDTLGLKLINRYGSHYAEVQAPGLMLGLHPMNKENKLGNNLSIGFGVRKFDEEMKALVSRGIDVKIEEDGWVRLAYFTDPDGNQMYLAENKD